MKEAKQSHCEDSSSGYACGGPWKTEAHKGSFVCGDTLFFMWYREQHIHQRRWVCRSRRRSRRLPVANRKRPKHQG